MKFSRILVLWALSGITFSCSRERGDNARQTSEGVETSGERSAAAAQTLAILRERFRVPGPEPEEADAVAQDFWSPLAPGVAESFKFEVGGVRPSFAPAPPVDHGARVSLPKRSVEPFSVEDIDSGIIAAITLHDVRDTSAAIAEGYLVYPGAHASGNGATSRDPYGNGRLRQLRDAAVGS
jgi:hypothetical protein